MATRIGVDIGGTFTDFVVYEEETGSISVEKVPTTPGSPQLGCIDAVTKGATGRLIEQCEYFLHGTTVGLNALIERRGATVGLLCTEGFRDVLEIRRGSRGEAYDLFWKPPEPIVPRYLRLAAAERVDASGNIVRPLEPASIDRAVQVFREHGVTAVAVCFVNAYLNPAHEIQAGEQLRRAGFTGDISLSHHLSREYRDFERTSTTVIDAFVKARMADYLDQLAQGLGDLGFAGQCLITRSGGGSMSFGEARSRAFETINSGPVAAAEGAGELARALGLGNLVTADVGGTSFDTSLIVDGRPHVLYQGEVGGMPIQAQWVDVRSIGAGGGSIAFLDGGGLLHVGPRSAGAQPGPACYCRGGVEPTVTDAALFLGMLGEGLLASNLRLDRGKAQAALETIAGPLDCTPEAAAIGIIKIACANMANAIREITVERGVDPRQLKLLAIGGAGPLLAVPVANELEMTTVIVPPFAGNFSAWGLIGSDLVRSASRTQLVQLTAADLETLSTTIAAMFAELARRGDDRSFMEHAAHELSIGMRFSGQEHSLTIPVPYRNGKLGWTAVELEETFRAAYRKTFGISLDNTVEIITIRTAIRRPLPRKMPRIEAMRSGAKAASGSVQVYSFALKRVVAAVTLSRSSLDVGQRHLGPAIIHEETTTTFVDADFSFHLDSNACLVLTRERRAT